MRSTVWASLLLASQAYSQETVSVCESYLVTGISTFTKYNTYYVTDGAIGANNTSTTAADSSTSMRSFTLPTASTSSSLTNGGIASSRSLTIMRSSKSVLLPDDNSGPVAPTTPIPTSSQTSTLTGSATTGTTNPTATSGTFAVAFTVPKGATGSPIYAYLIFDDTDHSKLVSNSTQAALFYVVDTILRSGTSYVAIDAEAEPTRFALQDTEPTEPVQVSIKNDQVVLSGIDSYCLLGEQLVVVETGDEAPAQCFAAIPQLLPRSAGDSTTTSSLSSAMSITSPTTASSSLSSSSAISATSDFSSSSSSTSTASNFPAVTSSSTSTVSSSSTSSTSSSSSSSSPSTTASTTSLGSDPVVTDKAYIDTVLRHHNRHRANHTASPLTWNDALAATAKKIADTCIYGHVVDTDCPTYPDAACYGQNIGAGYLPTQMGAIISDGFYNGEVNHYTYYGAEPDENTLHEWGHFTQIVWKGSSSIGCYTTNCTDSGLQGVDPTTGIMPYFTVCNYADPGNYLDEFADNVIKPLGCPTITANYGCQSDENCEDGLVGVNANLNVGSLALCVNGGA